MPRIENAPPVTVEINGWTVSLVVVGIDDLIATLDDDFAARAFVVMDATVDGDVFRVGGGWLTAPGAVIVHGEEHEPGRFVPFEECEFGADEDLAEACGIRWDDADDAAALAALTPVWEALTRGSILAYDAYKFSR